jgi:Spy/CpxP family protein refolding chaperone
MIHELSEYEARVLTEMIVIRARAKARIFQVLTPEQKALVSQKRRALRRQDGEELRGISVY